ncbi:MAG: hypothetical protein AUJ01_02655 [Acidobacteria bacterium 13_1_40CM_3_65_5]|nr:MAG: hypothetical protein AUJ01_02655 [Acidobacteria bacterium 13_1_40CM_3_65_5]
MPREPYTFRALTGGSSTPTLRGLSRSVTAHTIAIAASVAAEAMNTARHPAPWLTSAPSHTRPAASPNRKLSESTPITAPYRSGAYQCDAILTSAPHPIDCAKRLIVHAATNAAKPADAPNARVAAIDPIIPARNMRRPPITSAAAPFTSLPAAYASTPAELIRPSAALSRPRPPNSASSRGAATDKFVRHT